MIVGPFSSSRRASVRLGVLLAVTSTLLRTAGLLVNLILLYSELLDACLLCSCIVPLVYSLAVITLQGRQSHPMAAAQTCAR
jgi:hypothetical protein